MNWGTKLPSLEREMGKGSNTKIDVQFLPLCTLLKEFSVVAEGEQQKDSKVGLA